jgi:hypothetical protein
MTLEQLSFIAEIVAAAAVVISLVYVALQIKQNTMTLASSAQRDSANIYIEFQKFMVRDKDLLATIIRSETDPGSLDEVERRQAWAVVDMFIEIAASEYYRFKHHILPASAWEPIVRGIRDLMAMPIYQEYWAARNHLYADDYRVFIDRLISESGGG